MYAKPKCPPLVKLLILVVIAVEVAVVALLAFGQPAPSSEVAAPDSSASVPVANDQAADSKGEGADAPAPEPVTVTVTFAGDCILGTDENFSVDRNFNTRFEKEGEDVSYFLRNVADLFGSDDLTVVNLEGSLTDSDERADRDYAFKGQPGYAKILSGSGVEAASLANDHARDYGDAGYNDTIETLDADGVSTFGFDRIAYRDVKGVKVALIGVAALEEMGTDYTTELIDNIAKAKAEGAQLVLVYAHWGVDKSYDPTEADMRLARAAIDAGADVVVGSNPHVVQGWEVYKDRYILYSLGNFCYGGNSNPDDKDCLLFQQTFAVTGDEVAPAQEDDVKFIACSISSTSERNNFQPTLVEGADAERIMEKARTSNEKIAAMAADLAAADTNEGE